jgi:hypothetical protein
MDLTRTSIRILVFGLLLLATAAPAMTADCNQSRSKCCCGPDGGPCGDGAAVSSGMTCCDSETPASPPPSDRHSTGSLSDSVAPIVDDESCELSRPADRAPLDGPARSRPSAPRYILHHALLI